MAVLGKRDDTAAARINPADAHTILGREARFNGKLSFDGAVRIDGKFEGEIHTDDLLLIGPGAEVKATLHVGSVVINGTVEGDVTAKASVEIKSPGKLKGNVTTPTLVIEKGVVFDGSCTMTDVEQAPAPSKPASPPPPPPPPPSAS